MLDHIESDADFEINKFKLEEEAERQPYLIRHYAKKLAIWSAKVIDLKRKLEYVEGLCAETIRNNPRSYDLKKDTDTVVYKLAKGEPDYIEVHDEYVEAKQREGYYEGSMKALIQKGSMIKELVSLWLNNYYSSPIVGKKEVDHRIKLRTTDNRDESTDI